MNLKSPVNYRIEKEKLMIRIAVKEQNGLRLNRTNVE